MDDLTYFNNKLKMCKVDNKASEVATTNNVIKVNPIEVSSKTAKLSPINKSNSRKDTYISYVEKIIASLDINSHMDSKIRKVLKKTIHEIKKL